ncbi:MAG: hypothetical protein PHC61_10530 [Chitinivibrionales bacterium]|nr:hypothetical protein [Chitinivibrionales bacterium]
MLISELPEPSFIPTGPPLKLPDLSVPVFNHSLLISTPLLMVIEAGSWSVKPITLSEKGA